MKIQLSYSAPHKVETDLLAVVLDKETPFHDLGRTPLAGTIEQVQTDINAKTLRRPYFAPMNPRSAAGNLIVRSTAFETGQNSWEALKTAVAKIVREARERGLNSVALVLNTPEAVPYIGKAVEGAILGSYTFAPYKRENKEKKRHFSRMRLDIVAMKSEDERNRATVERYITVSKAVNMARDLINEPGGVATPAYLVETAGKIANGSALDLKVWDAEALREEGFNGLIAVGKGSAHPPAMIRLAYRNAESRKTLALVGKGVTFDTGGISLKPPDKMWEMKGDMSGGAAVLAAMQAIGKLKPPVNVVGIVPAAENSPDANAQRPGDIFRAKNGKTVMVDNTDAEGRLILTDGLFVAGQEKATHIVDAATLTGSCVRALGPSIAGIMGNSPELIQAVIASGRNHGESFWELPLPEEYKEMLKTPYADINNIGGSLAGASTAGLFLQEFVPKRAAWAHLDIAGPYLMEKNWKYYEPGGVGFGAKTMVDLAERFDEHLR